MASVPSTCKDANVDDQLREINGTRWTDFDDEDHANELLDDPNLKYLYLSIVRGGGEEESDEDYSGDEGSEGSGDVSIDTDADDEEFSRMDSVINPASSPTTDHPAGRRKIIDEYSTDEDGDSLDDEDDGPPVEENEDEASEEETPLSLRQAEAVKVSDDEHEAQEDSDYSQEYRAYDQQTGKSHNGDDGNEKDDDDEEAEESDDHEDYEANAQREVDERRAWREEKEKEAYEEAEMAKQAERERARAIQERKEEQRQQEERERRRKEELARLRREAEAQGQKLTKSSVKVERNIGAYSLDGGGAKRSPGGSRPSSSGWSKVAANPKPSSGGWSKVSANNKKS